MSKVESKLLSCCVQGAGLLGLYASILFKEAGYKEIFCSDIHHDRLDMAAKFGALPIKLGSEEEHSLKNESCDVVLEVYITSYFFSSSVL